MDIKLIRLPLITLFAGTLFINNVYAINDPITSNHPLWVIPQGQAEVDGIISAGEWSKAFSITRSQAWRDDGVAKIYMMHAREGLYLALEVDDKHLWADGLGNGNGNRWEVETDDSITFYFDPDNSRDLYVSDQDRVFGINLGNPESPVNGSQIVRRWKYAKGSGDGGVPDVIPGGQTEEGTIWATRVNGSVNNNADDDQGWVTEIFLPWRALNMTAPVHAQSIGMNFDLIFDSDGGGRNLTDNRTGASRFQLPAFVDDHIQGSHSSYHSTQAGVKGPVNYAKAMFVTTTPATRPQAIRDLGVKNKSSYGVTLNFTAPAGTANGQGHVTQYEIRYSQNPIIDDTSWSAATLYPNSYTARLKGRKEAIKIADLQPATTYYIAIRGRINANGQLGDLSNSPSFTTATQTASSDQGRLIVSPNGNHLMFENGTPFIPVGEHAGISWGYFRNLYPGDIWDPLSQKYLNFSENPSFEGTASPHFETLAAAGVNTLRLYLETLDMDQTGNPEIPRGRYWIEYPAGHFNPDVKQYLHNVLEEADKHGIYLIIAPFDSGQWDETFTKELPYYRGNGGPLADINDFFQNAQTLNMAKARMKTVIDWVKESPHSDHVLAWDPLSEWDSFEWTLNAEGNVDPGRETEMRRRVEWITALTDYIHEQDPDHLVMNSTTVRDPRGPLARYLFYTNNFDFLAPHFYTISSEEPINNPDLDTKIKPAVENGLLTTYWLTHLNNQVPILNSEWGMTRSAWPNQRPTYSADFTQQEDDALFRTVSWSGLSSGQLGSGVRIVTEELVDNYNSLSDSMRDIELTISRFVNATSVINTSRPLQSQTLSGSVSVSSEAHIFKTWGSHNGQRGIIYILQNGNETSGFVSDAELSIKGFDFGQVLDIEFWSTQGTASVAQSSQVRRVSQGGDVTVQLPGFNEDLAVSFKVSSDVFSDAPACAIFAENKLHIPCVSVANDIYTADFSVSNNSPLQLTLSGLNITTQTTNQQCAEYKAITAILHLPCVTVSNISYWADLQLINSNPVSFQLLNAGQI